MADSKERNLLSEIAFLTRLIGQHKNQIASNKKWNANAGHISSAVDCHGENVHSDLIKSTKPIQVSSYKCVRSVVKQKHSPYVKISDNQSRIPRTEDMHQKTNVYVNPKFNRASLDNNKLNVDAVLGINPSNSKVSNVHINPNFYGVVKVSDNSSEVIINSKLGNAANVELKSAESVTKNNSISEQKHKVHVNPKFCKLLPPDSPHTQLRTLVSNKVHVNPKLVERVLKEKNESGVSQPKAPETSTKVDAQQPSVHSYCHNVLPKSNTVYFANSYKQKQEKVKLISPQSNAKKNEFITLGKRKLVRINQKPVNETKSKERIRPRRNSISSLKQKRVGMVSPRSIKKAKSITSKYKLVKIHATTPFASSKVNVRNKYKIDRTVIAKDIHPNYNLRINKKDNLSMRLKKLKTPQRQRRFSISSARTSNGNLVWKRTWSLQAKEFKTTNTKLYRIGSSPLVKKDGLSTSKANNGLNSSLVRIGGVLYKSSRNKLTRSHGPVNTPKRKTDSAVPLKKKGKLTTKKQVLLIRGHKFIMDAQGKTLRRLSPADSTVEKKPSAAPTYSLRRVDIGGVTFIEKSSNVLMRTDTHKARSLLSYAKQKSIATLMKKLKKNNQPCIFYHKFGKCLRMEKGTCPCVHDRKHVAVCKRFLQAKCSIDGCLLSHDVVPEKMPTCRYFLEGCCTRTDCPYLHVKVNSKADICTSFLQGYCSNAEKCKKRHVNICPDFEKKGKCLKGKNCPYPHLKAKRSQMKKRLPIQISKPAHANKKCVMDLKKAKNVPIGKVELKRYYLAPEEAVGISTDSRTKSESQTGEDNKVNANIPCKPKVSSSGVQGTVGDKGVVMLSTSKNNLEREKLGPLPSFIPL